MPRAPTAECASSAKPFLMYGLTEAFKSIPDPEQVDLRPDSIGKVPNNEVLVMRSDGTLCGRGISMSTVALVIGYWNDERSSAFGLTGGNGPWAARRSQSGRRLVRTDEEACLRRWSDEMIKTRAIRSARPRSKSGPRH